MITFEEALQKLGRKQGALRRRILGAPLGETKIFGIGLNKTGTSTLGACFRTLGFRHLYDVQRLSRFYFNEDYDSIYDVMTGYDSFEDWPIPLMYQQLHERYGSQAKFILTKRKTPDVWVKSLSKHAKRINFEGARNLRRNIYGYEAPDGHEAEHIDFYENHNRSVVEYFAQQNASDQLLTVCWEDGDGWDELCGFLGLPKPWYAFPHVNKAPKTQRQ